jgi:prepilin-type N-terminal cleavage/methylation domain-containing protein
MMINKRRGFTLIEILIVVAIIAILASVVLVGLGPTQSLGRDARRVSDLHEVQNGLELFYNKSGAYPVPTVATWGPATTAGTFSNLLTTANIGVSVIPNDPNTANNYVYAWTAAGGSYILAATLENGSGGSWAAYQPPTIPTFVGETGSAAPTCAQAVSQFCLTL